MNKMSFTDIHTHILPFVDDGPDNLQDSLSLLKKQKAQGVDRVILTPHFYPAENILEDFLYRRDQSFKLVKENLDLSTMPEIKLGAEVRFSPEIISMDLKKLTLGESDYILIELDDVIYPPHICSIVSELSCLGYTPVLAHVERCLYFRKDPHLLAELIRKGALAHITAESLTSKYDRGFSKAALYNGYAHLAASDTHDLTYRKPNLTEKLSFLSKDLLFLSEDTAFSIWNNISVFPEEPEKMSKFFGKYR